MLVLLSQTIVALLRTERLYREDFDSLPAAFAEHREIVDAIADGDSERAGQAMADHLAHVAIPIAAHDTIARAAS